MLRKLSIERGKSQKTLKFTLNLKGPGHCVYVSPEQLTSSTLLKSNLWPNLILGNFGNLLILRGKTLQCQNQCILNRNLQPTQFLLLNYFQSTFNKRSFKMLRDHPIQTTIIHLSLWVLKRLLLLRSMIWQLWKLMLRIVCGRLQNHKQNK